MGTKVEIGGYPFPVRGFSITEDSVPLSAADTTGSTGLLNVTISAPDPDLEYVQDTGMKWLMDFGHTILQAKPIFFKDTRLGTLSGRVSTVSRPSKGTIQLTAAVKLNRLNIFNVTAQPFTGTLGNLLRYYVRLALPDEVISVDSSLNTRAVAVPGWQGELWYHLKMLAQAHEFDISSINDVITFRRLRQNDLPRGLDISRSQDAPVPQLAQTIEVYRYNNRAITNELVYPPGGWKTDTQVLNVNAGEVAEYTLQLSASVSSIQQPQFRTNVGPDYDSAPVYTVVANDGLPLNEAQWTGSGGWIRVEIGEDSSTLTVRLRGPQRIPVSTGGFASSFSIALASDTAGSYYSTLRILGSGVAYDKVKTTIRTGATEDQTGTVVGVTIDNPFLSDKDQQYRAGVRAASEFAIAAPSISGSITNARLSPGTTLGNVAGARVSDKETKRPYRVRNSTLGPGAISHTAEDDLLHDDIEGFRLDKTYGEVDNVRANVTYGDDYLMGLR